MSPTPGARSRRIGVLCIAGSAASFALLPVLAKVAYAHGIAPFALLALRFGIAASLLWAVTGFWAARGRVTWPSRDLVLVLTALGGVVLSGEVILYFLSLERIDVGLAEVLLFLYPVWVVVIATVLLRQPQSRLVVACSGTAVLGAALTVGGIGGGGADLTGVLLAVGASMGFAAYVVISGRLVRRAGSLLTTTLVTTGAAVTFIALAVGTGSVGPNDGPGWASIIAMAVVGTVVAFGFLSAGLARLPAADASVISTVEPAVAIVLGAALLGEDVGLLQLVGVALVLGSVAVLLRRATESEVLDPVVGHE